MKVAYLLGALSLAACSSSSSSDSLLSDPTTAPATTDDADGGACAVDKNDDIRQRLAPTCIACHGANTNKPFFASLEAFEDLLVYEPKYVTPNDAEDSDLIQLLEARAPGTYPKMPPVGDSFAAQEAAGQTKITMAELKDWINHLPARSALSTSPSPDAPTTRRLTAEEMIVTLRRNLGLQESGLHATSDVDLVVRASDAAYITGESTDPNAMSLFEALGGPNTLASRPRQTSIAPSMMQLVVQISQDWCGKAVAIPGNPALFRYATVDSKSVTDADSIKKNISYLYLRFLGDPPTDAAVDAIFTKVFVDYEPNGSDVAWTAVCANLLRHPQWLTL